MTELLPEGDRILIDLGDGESVEVSDGKCWVLSIITDADLIINGGLDLDVGELSKMTFHGGDVIEATGGTSNVAHLRGWEFDYSQ